MSTDEPTRPRNVCEGGIEPTSSTPPFLVDGNQVAPYPAHVRLKVRLRTLSRSRNPSCTWQAGKRSAHTMRPQCKPRVRHVPWSRVPCSWYIVPRCTKHVFRETCAPMPVVAPCSWWRGQGLNLRLLAHEASELPLLHPAIWCVSKESNFASANAQRFYRPRPLRRGLDTHGGR